jgi:hypothetical protein
LTKTAEWWHEYSKKNAEHIKAMRKARYAANPEKYREKSRKFYAAKILREIEGK